MPSQSHQLATAGAQPPEPHLDSQSLFGLPALLEGEDVAAYAALSNQIRCVVAPRDVIEEVLVRDFVDLLWETIRLRRLKAKLMRAAAHQGLNELSQPLAGSSYDLADRWARRDKKSLKEVNALLRKAGLDREAIAAQTLAVKLDTFERIDRMIMQTEARRNIALREIDRHRDVLAQRLSEVSAVIEATEFKEIERTRKAVNG
jgi:hypothetical protein